MTFFLYHAKSILQKQIYTAIEFNSKEDFDNINDIRICIGYRDTCIRFIDELPIKRRLYFGATFDKKVNGIFSFVPCKESGENFGFERPIIELEGRVNSNRNTGFKPSEITNIDESTALWNNIVKQIFSQNLKIGWGFKMPKQKSLNHDNEIELDSNCKRKC